MTYHSLVAEMVWLLDAIPCGVNNLMRTYYTHRLTQRSLSVWLEVGRIVTEWLPKQGLYYRDPRISDTRRPVLPPGRAESGSWPVAQIAIISSITCSTDSHLWALIVEPYRLYCGDLRMLGICFCFFFLRKAQTAQRRCTCRGFTCRGHVRGSRAPSRPHADRNASANGERDFFCGHYVSWHEAFVLSSPLCDEGERLGIYSALFKRKISCLLTSTL